MITRQELGLILSRDECQSLFDFISDMTKDWKSKQKYEYLQQKNLLDIWNGLRKAMEEDFSSTE